MDNLPIVQLSAGRVESAAETVEASVGGFLEGMLPDSDDPPAFTPQLPVHALIAGHVGLAFPVPECAVGFRPGVALGTGVPTASAAMRRNVKCQDVTLLSSFYNFLSDWPETQTLIF